MTKKAAYFARRKQLRNNPTPRIENIVRKGKKLREARKAAGLNQTGLSRLAGVSPSTIGEWERGMRDFDLYRFKDILEGVI